MDEISNADERALCRALSRHYGDGGVYGVTVNSFTSVSLEPMLVLVCLDNSLSGLEIFLASRLFGVNVLAEEQHDVSDHFASRGSDRSHGIEAARS